MELSCWIPVPLSEIDTEFSSVKTVISSQPECLILLVTASWTIRHIEAEHEAMAKGDMGKALSLSDAFHVIIADIAGHTVYANMVRQLISRSSLIIALYWKRQDTTCESHSHHALIDAFANGDAPAAQEVMKSHIIDLHSGLDLRQKSDSQNSLAAALAR